MPGDRAVSARLRADAIPLRRDAALRPAGGARQRSAGSDGRARRRARGRWPATIGAAAPPAWSPRCGRNACAVSSRPTATTSRTSPASGKPAPPEQEHRLWYQYYFHTERGRAGLRGQPPRALQAAVAAVVAELAIRRCDLRAHRRVVRQSRFRRGGDPLLPRTASATRRAIPLRADRAALAAQPRSRCRRSCCMAPATASRRRKLAKHAPFFTGPYQHRRDPGGRAQSAAGDAEGRGRGGAGAGARHITVRRCGRDIRRGAPRGRPQRRPEQGDYKGRPYFVAFSRNRISAARSAGEPMRCSGILVPGV